MTVLVGRIGVTQLNFNLFSVVHEPVEVPFKAGEAVQQVLLVANGHGCTESIQSRRNTQLDPRAT